MVLRPGRLFCGAGGKRQVEPGRLSDDQWRVRTGAGNPALARRRLLALEAAGWHTALLLRAAAGDVRISSSCPRSSRASTSFLIPGKQGVDGRVKPGHDEY